MTRAVPWAALAARPLAVLSAALLAAGVQAQQPLVVAPPAAADGEIQWVDNPSDAFATARRSGRPIVAYVTCARCGFCRKMERETWSRPAVARLVGSRFVAMRIDADRYPAEVQRLGVRIYPTTVVFTPEGTPTTGIAGFSPPERITELLEPVGPTDAVAQAPSAVK